MAAKAMKPKQVLCGFRVEVDVLMRAQRRVLDPRAQPDGPHQPGAIAG